MRKILMALLGTVCVSATAMGLTACDKKPQIPTAPENGGFETSDLSGWTVEYGSAFSNDSVSSKKTFRFDGDENDINVNATGNWYLCGKTFYGGYTGEETGAIRSTSFSVPEDGVISLKLAGGALNTGKGSTAMKDGGKTCYVGIYRKSDDKMLAKQSNEYFLEHTEDYVLPDKYEAGIYNTDNFYQYTMDLSAYAGEEVYIRIVDNDTSNYYGYICVDDIRIGESAEAQAEGEYSEKTYTPVTDVEAPSKYEIKNGGFETGNLAGWTVVEGDAFADAGVNAKSTWWAENITYSRDGNYHYGMYKPTATGRMRSSEFELGGTGYISWKMGGCRNNDTAYIRFMVKGETEDKEVARYSNFMFKDMQFPYVQNGMRLLNMVQYYVDLSEHLGETMYIEVVDNNTSSDDTGCITLDSVKTYWQEKPVWYTSEAYRAFYDNDTREDTEYQIKNGGFETGDITGWEASWTDEENAIGEVSADETWDDLKLPYNKSGKHFFNGMSKHGNTGTLTSEAFTVGGIGMITFKLGGGEDYKNCYISVIDADSEEELLRYGNLNFSNAGLEYVNNGSNLANMILYKADLSSLKGRQVKLRIVDNSTDEWGFITADSFITYYRNKASLPSGASLLTNLLGLEILGENDRYQVLNGDFEAGALLGWTSQGAIAGVSDENIWWGECISFNKDGEFFANGWTHGEDKKGTLTSSAFEIGGSGWITFKLGGGKNTSLCYVEIIDAETGETYAKYGNHLFNADNFGIMGSGTSKNPVNAEEHGVFLANLALYKADLSKYIGETVKIRIVDNAVNDWGVIFADSFITYYANESDLPEKAHTANDIYVRDYFGKDDEKQVDNGNFETGDLTGWTILTEGMTGGVSQDTTYWDERLPYNKGGKYFLNGFPAYTGIDEAQGWAIRSTTFKLSGSGFISLRMGGNDASVKVYQKDGTLIGTYWATHFSDTNFPFEGDGEGKGSWAGMRTYFIDLNEYLGQELYLELHDSGTKSGWANAFFDEVITYYEQTPDIANGYDEVEAAVSGVKPDFVYETVQLKWILAEKSV